MKKQQQHNNDNIIIGQIGAPHGVMGWVRVYSFTDPADNIANYPIWLLHTGKWQQYSVQEIRPHKDFFVARIGDVDTRELAGTFTNLKIAIARSWLPELEDDEYYWADLEGMTVINQHGSRLGVVDHLFATGANDVMVVRDEGNGQAGGQVLIPFILSRTVLEVKVPEQQIYVEWS